MKGARTVTTLTGQIIDAEPSLKQHKDSLQAAIQEAVLDVINVFFDRHNAVDLSSVGSTHDTRWLLDPLIEQGMVTRLVAQGGSLKSLFALAVSATVVLDTPKFLGIKPELSGPVLYLDWEADSVTHAMRLEALCKAKGLRMIEGIHYMPMASSLYLSQRRVMSAVADLHPVLLIVDSNAMARGATGEGGAEDSTIRMITALRSFGPAALVVDHKSEEKIRRGLTGGYGSIFNRNLARLEWEVVRTNRTLEATSLALRLEKANNIRTKVELGFRFEIAANGHGIWNTANIAPVDPSSIISFDPSDNTAASKIYNYLRTQTEAQPVSAIAKGTGLRDSTVRMSLKRDDRFENLGTETKGLWRAIDQDTDEGYQDGLPDPY
jgi:hypothetical protein